MSNFLISCCADVDKFNPKQISIKNGDVSVLMALDPICSECVVLSLEPKLDHNSSQCVSV